MRRSLVVAGALLAVLPLEARGASPRPIDTPPPIYPKWAIGTGVSTEVELRARIGRNGKVNRVDVTPYDVSRDLLTREMRASFDSAAVQAVRRWTFEPATHGGRAVSVWWTLHVPFADPEDDPTDSMAFIGDSTEIQRFPEPLARQAPLWPAAVPYVCRGRVTVRIFPGPDGRVWAAHVAKTALGCQDSRLRPIIDATVVRAARQWRYTAGDHEGESILIEFQIPGPRLDAPVVVGCVRDSVTGKLRPEAEIFGRGEGHAFGMTDDHGWFVLRGRAAAESRLRAVESSPCRAGGFRSVHPWTQPGDEVTLYTARCQGGLR